MSQYPSYQPAYPGGPAQYDWQRIYGGPPRPGILTAIGVVSIIVASLGILGSGLFAVIGMGLFQNAKMATTWATSSSSPYNASVKAMSASASKVNNNAPVTTAAQSSEP